MDQQYNQYSIYSKLHEALYEMGFSSNLADRILASYMEKFKEKPLLVRWDAPSVDYPVKAMTYDLFQDTLDWLKKNGQNHFASEALKDYLAKEPSPFPPEKIRNPLRKIGKWYRDHSC